MSVVCIVFILATPRAKCFVAQTRDAKELARRVGAFVDVTLLVVIVDGDHVMRPRRDIHLLSCLKVSKNLWKLVCRRFVRLNSERA